LLVGQALVAWVYAGAGGMPFVGAAAAGLPVASVAYPVLVSWNSGWRVVPAPQPDAPECVAAVAAVRDVFEPHHPDGGLMTCTTAPNPADGCLVTVQPLNTVGVATGPELVTYYRFGIVLSGNLAARSLLPALPEIDAAARGLLPMATD
jgi:hypothetical protein